jgi:hypothetical protein
VKRLTTSPLLLALLVAPPGCTTLSPDAASVRLTRNPQDVAGCRVVGQVSGMTGNQALPGTTKRIKNAAAALGADVVFLTLSVSNGEGTAYRCKPGDPRQPVPVSVEPRS